jgi:fermentation-respiration switch protein FrsA (DUF1100 family)
MATLKWLLIIALAGYCGFALLIYLAQRTMMYFPDRERISPAAAGFSAAEEIVLDTSDGERVIVWHVPPRGERPVILYFHGNGGALHYRIDRFREFTEDGNGLVALSYRGYGGSTGAPSEAGLLSDAAAAYAFTAARHPPERIVLWGESLGTCVAVAVAAQKPVGRVVLESALSSAVDIAARHYPFLPVRWLMKDQFRSDQRIGAVIAPILMLHGARDEVVPIEFGERLFALAREPKRFVRFPEGGHEGLGALAVAKRFIEGQSE